MRWPYPKAMRPPASLSQPDWDCPEDACVCHPTKTTDKEVEIDIVLRDFELGRMGGAVCYVESPALIGDPIVQADGDGKITLTFSREPQSIILNWAPAGLPKGPPWPYRKLYYVDLRDGDLAMGRRLHNLGFSDRTNREENIAEFQRSYGHTMSGDPADAHDQLLAHHEGTADVLGEGKTEADTAYAFGPGPTQVASLSPHKSRDRRVGCAASVPAMPSPTTVDLKIRWTPITSTYKDLTAIFWVLRDAAKWKVPAAHAFWYSGSPPDDPIESGFWCRIPCTAQQNEWIARRTVTGTKTLGGDDAPAKWIAGSLLMTPHLYNLRYQQADGKVPMRGQDVNKCMFNESKKLNIAVNNDAAKYTNPTIVADAAKAWVITPAVDVTKAKDLPHYAGVNYGWHTSKHEVANKAWTRHCACHHVDYSQLIYLVAGFCLLEDGDDIKWVRTKLVYKNEVDPDPAVNRRKQYHRLAVRAGKPLKRIRYTKFGKFKG